MNVKYNEQEFIDLYNQGKSDLELAEHFKVTKCAIETKRRRLGLKAHKNIFRDNYIPTKQEIAIIIGTLLGDSTIRYVHSKCKNPNLTFVHSPKQEEYFNYLSNKLKNFRASSKRYVDKNKLNKYGYKLVFTGKNMMCLKTFRKNFYPENIKIIPIDIIKKYFTEESLYYMYMDDGSYDKTSNSYIINTQCFSKENLLEFTLFLKDKFNLDFNIKSDNSLYLCHISNNIFKNILLKYNECDSIKYKIG